MAQQDRYSSESRRWQEPRSTQSQRESQWEAHEGRYYPDWGTRKEGGGAPEDQYRYSQGGYNEEMGRERGGERYGRGGRSQSEDEYGSSYRGREFADRGSRFPRGDEGGLHTGPSRLYGQGWSGQGPQYANQRYRDDQERFPRDEGDLYGSDRSSGIDSDRLFGSSQDSDYSRSGHGADGSPFSNYGERTRLSDYGTSGSSGLSGGYATRGVTSHRGRGPKGYTRSDDRLKELICERLTEHHDIDASDITVQVSNQEVTLSGTVEDRRTKFMAEELVERCGGVKEIHNQLKVGTQSGASQQAKTQSAYGSQGSESPSSTSSAASISTGGSNGDKSRRSS